MATKLPLSVHIGVTLLNATDDDEAAITKDGTIIFNVNREKWRVREAGVWHYLVNAPAILGPLPEDFSVDNGTVVYMTSDSTYALASAASVSTGARLVACSDVYNDHTDPTAPAFFGSFGGRVITGLSQVEGEPDDGDPLYLSETPGFVTPTRPTGAGKVVRVMGFKHPYGWLFQPESGWIELSA